MSGRGGRFVRGRGGRGRGRDGRGRGSISSTVTTQKKGLCAALCDTIFTYNKKRAADQLAITLCQIVKKIGTIYRQETSNGIHNGTPVIIFKPVYYQDLINKQVVKEGQRKENLKRIQDARRRK